MIIEKKGAVMAFSIFMVFISGCLQNSSINVEPIIASSRKEVRIDVTKDNTNENQKASVDLSNKALVLLSEKKYEESLALFREAIVLDENNYEAHFNLAKVLALLQASDHKYFDVQYQIIPYLEKCIAYDQEYRKKLIEDKSFDILKKNYNYYLLLGYDTNISDDLKFILTHLSWYVPGSDLDIIYGSLKFSEDNTFEIWYYTPDSLAPNIGKKHIYVYNGIYTVSSNKVTIILDNKMLKKRTSQDIHENTTVYEDNQTIKLKLSEDGNLKTDIFEYPFLWNYPANG